MLSTDDTGRRIENSILTVFNTKCPKCGSTHLELRDYSMVWRDGRIYCSTCGTFVRNYEAGWI
jgi:uncharacterized Zn finger protein (UPF0148 family)